MRRFSYLYAMAGGETGRRLTRVDTAETHGIPIVTTLFSDNSTHDTHRDYFVAVEVIGDEIRVFEGGTLVTDVRDGTSSRGGIGLYSEAAAGSRFTDVRVNHYSPAAPSTYSSAFTTSRFADFFHHLHSYDDGLTVVPIESAEPVASWVASAAPIESTPSDDEARAYDALQRAAGTDVTAATGIRIARVVQADATVALLVLGREPMEWRRVGLQVSLATSDLNAALDPPSKVKITNVAFGQNAPNEESILLLVIEPVDLTSCRVEFRLTDDNPWEMYYEFGAEHRFGAGTRIRVYAGNAAEPSPAEDEVLQRYVASGDDRGALRLLGASAELRIVSGHGTLHKYRALRDDAYWPVRVKVLRSRDGAGVAVVMPVSVPSGSRFLPGRYRLAFTFQRDVSPVLTQGGVSTPEVAVIKLPWAPRSSSTTTSTLESHVRRTTSASLAAASHS